MKKISALIMLMGLTASMLVTAATPKFDNSRLFVKVENNSIMPQSGLISKVTHLFANNYLVNTTDATKLAKELEKVANIISTQKNYKSLKSFLPEVNTSKSNSNSYTATSFNDPKATKIWAFKDASRHGVSVSRAYKSPLSIVKEEIIVAVVDTGVDYNHVDLKNKMWVNENEIPGNGIDDDNNGYIDDVHGISTLDRDRNGRASGDPINSHSHGTHVSGTIAAEQNNNTGIAGISEKAMIMAIRTVPDTSDETDADIVESFLYAAKHGARLINCSFGKNKNEGGNIVNETITHIGEKYGALVFAAAGNDYGRDIDTRRTYPASFDSKYLVVVASTAKGGGLSLFSNKGRTSVDLAAPGSAIYSTIPGGKYGNMSGTSMATPVTVGVAAEILSNFPELTALELKEVLMKTVTKIDKFKAKMVSGGRVDLYNALQFVEKNFVK